MSLFDAELVRRLRKNWRQIVKADPKLRAEARRYRSFWTRHRDASSLRWLLPPAFAGIAALLPSWNAAGYMLAAWATILALVRTQQFQNYYRFTAPALLGLPITPQQILEKGVGYCFRSSLWLLADALAVAGSTYWFKAGASHAWLGVVPAAVLVWASALATSLILMGWRPRFPYAAFAGGAFVLSMIASPALSATGTLKDQLPGYVGTALIQATPPGWACQVTAWLLGVHGFPVVAAGLLTFWIALAVPGYRAFRQHFWRWEADETELTSTLRREMTEAEMENAMEYEETSPPVSRASDVEELVLRGDFLKPFTATPDVSRYWMERWILARFPGRRVLLDFLLGDSPSWSAFYRWGWMSLGIGFGLAWLASVWLPEAAKTIVGMAIFGALAGTTPLFGGAWPGLRPGPLGNRQIAIIALLPVRLRDISRTILAINAVRCLFALPCWVASFLALSFFLREPPSHGALVGAECWLISLLLQPFFLVFKYSSGTNDTSSGCLTLLMFIGACLMPFAAAVAALLTAFIPAPPAVQGLAFAALALTSFGLEAFYRWLYASKRLDLLAKSV